MTDEELFATALAKAPAERTAFLDQACVGQPDLRRQVEELLDAHEQPGAFLDRPAARLAVTSDLAPPESFGGRIGPYKLLQKLGEGGMGTVWVAEQEQPVKRRVALKVVKAGLDSEQVLARFEAERQALALMDHPNIAKVLDAGSTHPIADCRLQNEDSKSEISNLKSAIFTGRPYFVMELVRGVPITKYCDELNLSIRERLELFVPVCQAIQHAHQKGVIHRDIKPSNVLVAVQDGRPVPKVIDFGVAKALHQRLTERTLMTEFGAVVGTLEYMSPEQAELSALDIDTRADVYTLGVLLYELLTGSTPLGRERVHEAALVEVLRLIKEEEPPRPSTRLTQSAASLPTLAAHRRTEPTRLTREVRGELDWIVMKALEKDRIRRYESAGGLARDVERFLGDEPVEAGPPGVGYRLRKFVRRNRVAVFLVLFVMTGVFAILVNDLIAHFRLESARAEAQTEAKRAGQAEELALQRLEEVTAQKLRAEQAERRASDEAAVAHAVNQFFQQDLLGQADLAHQPGGDEGRDPNVTVRTLLDRAAKKLDHRFADQPLTEAAIRLTIADAYLALGQYREAHSHAEQSVRLRTAGLGANHPETLRSKHYLGLVLELQAKFDQAELLLTEVMQARLELNGPNHLDTLVSKGALASLYQSQGKFSRAEPYLQDNLRILTAQLGRDNVHTLTALHNLGMFHKNNDQFSRAEPLLYEAFQRKLAALGADHPSTIASQYSLAQIYSAQGRYEKAEPLFQEVLRVRMTQLEPDHPHTLLTKNSLAALYRDRGEYDRAEPLFLEVLQAKTTKIGADHPSTVATQFGLALLYQAQSKLELAEKHLREAAVLSRGKLGSEHPYTRQIVRHLIDCYEKLGQPAKAEPLCRELVSVWKSKSGPESAEYADKLALLGLSLLMQQKWTAAEPALRECLAIRVKNAPDAWTTFSAKSMLGGALLGQAKFSEAEPCLLEGYNGMNQRATQIPDNSKHRVPEALDRVVRLYEAWGNQAEAARWRAKQVTGSAKVSKD